MASFDFPSNPNVGDTFNDPVTGATFRWNGYGWDGGAGGGTGAIIVAPSPPPTPPDSALWWESDTGYMYIRYNDGNSAQWVQVNAVPNLANYVAKTGDVMTGPLTTTAVQVNADNPWLVLQKATAAGYNTIQGNNGANARWQMVLGNGATESGSNAGSDFSINAYNDAGAYSNTPIGINRASGAMTFNGAATFNTTASFSGVATFSSTLTLAPPSGAASITLNKPTGNGTAASTIAGYTAGSLRWNCILGNSTAESGSNVGSDFQLIRYTDAGVVIDAALYFKRSTGAASFSGGITAPSVQASTFYNGLTYFGYPTASDFYMQLSGNIRVLAWRGGVYNMSFDNSTGTTTWVGNSTPTMQLDFGGNLTGIGNITVNGNGFKPGGGSWAATSDVRIKTVEAEYTQGLDAVLALRPVVYHYNGNDSPAADKPSMHAKVLDKSFIGLVAQEAELPMPELVSKGEGFIDGKAVDDLRTLDSTALIYALINAVKELSARIATLEATP